ncbi:3371_t:CDS:2 [Cetraspora pellucida]|uniref:3371_t:CDS:1 n=1 Tax=Cetraspora pellucida TaxID=1433469 RepID=A0A9N9D502_9GLOM|nr:3371_t:CDS:2 [Cetraspora pellucida]
MEMERNSISFDLAPLPKLENDYCEIGYSNKALSAAENYVRKFQRVTNGCIIDVKKDRCKTFIYFYLGFGIERNRCKAYSCCQNLGKYNGTFQVEAMKLESK